MTRRLMLQGTGSDVGKSVLTAGLCRAFRKRGLTVRPFKPQNMSNNAAVTEDGGEIGRAQALQAQACGVAPHTDMNPVLLKPQGESGSQVVVGGKVLGNADARAYQKLKPSLLGRVLESFDRLSTQADLVLVEGAGSAAEVNLRKSDIANMGFALAAGIPVALIGDIDRGGVLAQLIGTWSLLSADEQGQVCGFIVNKFRGDLSLFDPGLEIIRQRTGWPSFGVVPWLPAVDRLPREDGFRLPRSLNREGSEVIRIAVPLCARVSNFDDLDPLRCEPDVTLSIVKPGNPLPGDADLIILPGSKATLADLSEFCHQGWDIDLRAHVRRGGLVLGICGGYQMLGTELSDPDGVEGPPATAPGLGLLDVSTRLTNRKTLRNVTGTDRTTGMPVSGYEMHSGRTEGSGADRPLLSLSSGPDGAISPDGRVMGCHIHGLFASDPFRTAFLQRLHPAERETRSHEADIESALDALAAHLETWLDLDALLQASAIISNSSAASMAPVLR